jgi:hypothetical protein
MNVPEFHELVEVSNMYHAAYREEATKLRNSDATLPTITPEQKALRDAQKDGKHKRTIL